MNVHDSIKKKHLEKKKILISKNMQTNCNLKFLQS